MAPYFVHGTEYWEGKEEISVAGGLRTIITLMSVSPAELHDLGKVEALVEISSASSSSCRDREQEVAEDVRDAQMHQQPEHGEFPEGPELQVQLDDDSVQVKDGVPNPTP